MAEIGAGTGTSYPGAIDVNAQAEVNAPAAGKTKARKEVVEDLTAAVLALQAELGTDPAGTLATVKAFLQTHHQTDGTHKNTHGPHKWLDEQDYANFTAAVAAAPGHTLIVSRSINLDANTTVPATVHLVMIDAGVINKNGFTLTINGPFEAPLKQVFSGFVAGDVTFGNFVDVVADWFGNSAAAIQSAYSAVIDGGKVYLYASTWACGTTVIDTTTIKTVHFKGHGFSKGATSPKITFTTTGTFCLAYYSSLEDIVLSGGNYPLTLGSKTDDPFTGAPNRAWTGTIKNVYATGSTASGGGIRNIANQLGHAEKLISLGNSGTGMFVDDGSNLNTHGVWISCGFNENDLEGIVQTGSPASNWSNFKFYGCQIEGNQKEAFKNTGVLKNYTFDSCWFENNNIGGAASNYDLYFNNISNTRIVVRNCTMAGSSATIKPIGFKGELTVEDNKWSGSTSYIACLDDNNTGILNIKDSFTDIDTLIDMAYSAAPDTWPGWTTATNKCYNASGRNFVYNIGNQNYKIPARFFGGITFTNLGATATRTFTLPNVTPDAEITFIVASGFAIVLAITGDDVFLPGGVTTLTSSTTLGDSITVRGISVTQWVIVAKNGTWT